MFLPMTYDASTLGTVAEWFAAIGTVGALLLTIQLVRKPARSREDVHVEANVAPDKGYGWTLLVGITNMEERPVTITEVSIVFAGKGRIASASVSLPLDGIPVRLEEAAKVVRSVPGEVVHAIVGMGASRAKLRRPGVTVEIRTSRARIFRTKAPVALPRAPKATPNRGGLDSSAPPNT